MIVRGDVPHEVAELSRRLGVAERHIATIRLHQAGHLRNGNDSRWMRFTAHQRIAADRCDFAWRARVGPLGLVQVEDALREGTPTGGVAVFGLIPIAWSKPSPLMLKGELMRYLAELPWAPDAILANRELRWQATGEGQLTVSAAFGAVEGTVTFHLNESGLPYRVEGMRPRQEGAVFREREWRGEFSEFSAIEGRVIPHAARVSWHVEGRQVEVWRGRITQWSAGVPIR